MWSHFFFFAFLCVLCVASLQNSIASPNSNNLQWPRASHDQYNTNYQPNPFYVIAPPLLGWTWKTTNHAKYLRGAILSHDGETIYVTTTLPFAVFALRAGDRHMIWAYPGPTDEISENPLIEPSYDSVPTLCSILYNGHPVWALIVAHGPTVYALNTKTGQPLWTYHLPSSLSSARDPPLCVSLTPQSQNQNDQFDRDTQVANYVFLTLNDPRGEVVGLSPSSGQVVWGPLLIDPMGLSNAAAFVEDAEAQKRILVVAGGNAYLYGVDIGSVRIAWRFNPDNMNATFTAPVIDRKRVYVADSEGYLYALSPVTGEEYWRYNLGAPVPPEYSLSVDRRTGAIFVGTERKRLFGVKPDGQTLWNSDLGCYPVAISTSHNDAVFVSCNDGNEPVPVTGEASAIAYRESTGGFLWRRALKNVVYQAPILGHGRKIYYVSLHDVKMMHAQSAAGTVMLVIGCLALAGCAVFVFFMARKYHQRNKKPQGTVEEKQSLRSGVQV